MAITIEVGGNPPAAAEDILSKDGGIIKRRGPVTNVQNVANGFYGFRQHMNGQGGCRPAPSIGGYPRGLLIGGIGQETGGYGSQNSGGGTYINMDRARESAWVTDSFNFALFAQSGADNPIGDIKIYCDTQAWDDARRSYFEVKLDLAAKTISIMGSDGLYKLVDGNAHLPGFNQNKFNRTYCSFTYWPGPTGSSQIDFGKYGAFQIGGKTYDLRGLGAGSASYAPQVGSGAGWAFGSEALESFAGGRNPGFSVATPVAGKWAGIVLYDWQETIGDTLV